MSVQLSGQIKDGKGSGHKCHLKHFYGLRIKGEGKLHILEQTFEPVMSKCSGGK